MVEDVRPAIEEDGDLSRVPDKVASPFITVEDVLIRAAAVQIG